jgi:hypothetical protein
MENAPNIEPIAPRQKPAIAAKDSLDYPMYPESRNFSGNLQKLGLQLGTDSISQALKEFWPDVKCKFSQRHKAPQSYNNP